MYAIIENGGKQYKAIEGGYIEIDLLPEEVGKKKTFAKVLLLSTEEKVEIGVPYIKGVSVDATIISHFKAPKVIVFKYRAKQRYRVKTGHRQQYSRVLIDSIAFPGKAAAKKKTSELAEPVKKPVVKKTATKKKKTTTVKKPSVTAKKSTTTAKKSAAKSATVAKKKTSELAEPVKKPVVKKTATKKKKTTTVKKPSATAKKSTTAVKKPVAKSTTATKKSTTKKSTAVKKSSSADKK